MTTRFRFVSTNGITLHVAEAGPGDGPLVVLCHGFPESWYSWRHQIPVLADAGYHVVAPHMRGYGRSDRPREVDAYTQLHLVGDMVGLLDALGAPTATIVGHDWGAVVAWNAALWRPDRFGAVAALSVPFRPRPASRPTEALRLLAGRAFHDVLFFHREGEAEADLERDVRRTVRDFLWTGSGDIEPGQVRFRTPKGDDATFTDHLSPAPCRLPDWLTEADVDHYAAELAEAGFRGGLSWYRCIDRTWELTAPWHGARVGVPALFVYGTRDDAAMADPAAVEAMPRWVPDLEAVVALDGCGHWAQQERPDDVNRALLGFLRTVAGAA